MRQGSGTRAVAAFSTVLLTMGTGTVVAARQKSPDSAPFAITRASLAPSASFRVTQTLTPKDSQGLTREYRVQVKGNKARLDYEDQAIGPVRYVANEKGVFFYIPGNKSAVKQTFKGGVEGALKLAFSQVRDQMSGAQKVGTATVNGQPTIIYKAPKTGALVYMGTRPGFRLPVKTILSNEGGTSTVNVSEIKLNVALADSLFALPAGTQIMDSGSAPAAPGTLSGASH